MIIWQYKIQSNAGLIITQNPDYAELKSKLGNIVYCTGKSNIYQYNH